MVYKSSKPYEVEFKRVKNNRGKTVDKVTNELVQSYEYKPWTSTYGKDYNSMSQNYNNSQLSLPQLRTEPKVNESERSVKNASNVSNKLDANEVRAAFKANPEPVYLQGDEEFLKPNLVSNTFPNCNNVHEIELNDLLHHNRKYFAEIKGHCLEDICSCGKFYGKPKHKLDLK